MQPEFVRCKGEAEHDAETEHEEEYILGDTGGASELLRKLAEIMRELEEGGERATKVRKIIASKGVQLPRIPLQRIDDPGV